MSRTILRGASPDEIELAVWAAEFVRARQTFDSKIDLSHIGGSIMAANRAVEELRKVLKP